MDGGVERLLPNMGVFPATRPLPSIPAPKIDMHACDAIQVFSGVFLRCRLQESDCCTEEMRQ